MTLLDSITINNNCVGISPRTALTKQYNSTAQQLQPNLLDTNLHVINNKALWLINKLTIFTVEHLQQFGKPTPNLVYLARWRKASLQQFLILTPNLSALRKTETSTRKDTWMTDTPCLFSFPQRSLLPRTATAATWWFTRIGSLATIFRSGNTQRTEILLCRFWV